MAGRVTVWFLVVLGLWCGSAAGWGQMCAGETEAEGELLLRARKLLSGNWLPDLNTTLPSPHLYPHQWSWDAAFVAIGYAHYDLQRAKDELRSLFKGQWDSGLLPHIVFNPHTSNSYFPGPSYWKTNTSPLSVHSPETSGIVQPPVHAIAVMKIYRASGDKQFVREIFPQLLAWHNYLYRERDPHHEHLVYVRHPWESGMDNAPSWDAAFKRMVLKKGDVPPYQRKDNKVKGVDEKDRPTDFYYDRYVALMKIFYDNAYNETKIAEKCPFLIQDVLFNAILGRAEEDLAQLADIIGEPSEHLHNRARMTQSSILTKLWNVEDAAFYDFDLQSGESVKTRIGGGIAGIFGATLSGSNLERFLSMLDSEAAEGRLGTHAGYPVPTVFTDDNLFMANNYWRGPVWVNINYLLIDGLLSSGSDAAKLSARHLFEKTIELVYKSGFYEYFSPLDASPHGASNFSWTASLLIDLICDGDRRAMLYASSHSHRLGNFFPSCIFVSLLLCGLSMLAWKKQSIDRAQEQNQSVNPIWPQSELVSRPLDPQSKSDYYE